MSEDLTKGSVARSLLSFTIPLVLSGLLQQLFNWVDAFIVGNVNGELALAGIGATSSIYNLFITVITGFTAGLSVLTAQQYGRGERERISGTLSSFSVILTLFFLLVATLGIIFIDGILHLMDTPENIFSSAAGYLRIILIGIPFLALYNTYSAILRGLGNSRAPFVAVLISSVANVALDLVFVILLGLGASGAAAATVIAQAAMTVFIIIYAHLRYPILRFSSMKKDSLHKGLSFGLPPALQSGASSIGNVILQQFMNGFGEKTVAAITTAYRVDTVILLPITNLGSGIATVAAQNIGAGNEERARKVLRVGMLMMAAVSIILTFVVLLFGAPLIALFGLSSDTVEIGRSFFHGIAPFYIVFGLSMAVRGYLEGTGDMLFSALAGISFLVLRIICSYALEDYFGNMVIAYAEAIAWVFLLIIVSLRYRMRKLNQKALWK